MSSSKPPIDYKKIFAVVDEAAKLWNEAAVCDDHAYATEQAAAIFTNILPQVLSRFVRKNADYGGIANFLGARGQFADINPKYWKLKSALWDGKELFGESVEEILHDLIGHCLLTLYFLNQGSEGMPAIATDFGGGRIHFDRDLGPASLRIEVSNPLDPGIWEWNSSEGQWGEWRKIDE